MYKSLGDVSPEIIRALMRSENRRTVLHYFYFSKYSGNGKYLEEIVKETGISHSNVLGTIKGDGNKYSRKLSLEKLGLVKIIEKNGFRYYKLTEEGKLTVNWLFSSIEKVV